MWVYGAFQADWGEVQPHWQEAVVTGLEADWVLGEPEGAGQSGLTFLAFTAGL